MQITRHQVELVEAVFERAFVFILLVFLHDPLFQLSHTQVRSSSSSSGGGPSISEVVQSGHEAQKSNGALVQADTLGVVAVLEGDGEPVSGGQELVPPFAIKIFLFLLCLCLGLFDFGLSPKTEEVRSNADKPGTTTPSNPLGHSASLLHDGDWDHTLAGQMIQVLGQLESNVASNLQESNAVQGWVHVLGRLLGQQSLQPDVQRKKPRQTQGGSQIGDHCTEWCKEGW